MSDLRAAAIALGLLVGTQLVVMVLTYMWFRALGRAVYRRKSDETSKMHDYRQFSLGYAVVGVLGVGLLVVVFYNVSDVLSAILASLAAGFPKTLILLAGSLLPVVSFLLIAVSGYIGSYTYMRHVRGLNVSSPAIAIQFLKAWGWKLSLVWIGLLIVFVGPRGTKTVVLGSTWIAYYAVSPYLVSLFNDTRPENEFPDHVECVRKQSAEMHLSIAGPLVLKGADHREGIVAVVGFLPGHQYLVVTDYLLDNLSMEEFEAIVAHELGHISGRHIPLKILVSVVPPVMWLAAFEAGFDQVFVIGLAMVVPYLIIRGVVARSTEYAADSIAAEHVGGSVLADALENLADLNALETQTDTVAELTSGHPSVDKRTSRLRSSEFRGTGNG